MLLACLTTAAPPAPDQAPREADIFASPEVEVAQPQQAPPVDADAMAVQLEQTNDPLTLGGNLFLRLQYDMLERGNLETFRLVSPNWANLFLDSRPSSRLRGYMRGRVLFNPAIGDSQTNPLTQQPMQQTTWLLDQLWLKFDVAQRAYFTVGRQRVRWGVGRFWNPTDFLNRMRLDPLAIVDARVGATLIKLNVPIESLGYNFYGIANLTDVQTAQDVGGAVRAELVWGPAEIALSGGRGQAGGPWQLGVDASAGLGLLDVRFEVALQHGVQQTFFKSEPGQRAPTAFLRDKQWLAQALGGAEMTLRYSDTDTVTFGVEYFYNQLGYADASLYPQVLASAVRSGQPIPFLYLGIHYLAGFVYLPAPGSFNIGSITGSAIANLSDQSVISRLDVQARVLTYMDVNVYGTYHFGREGEFRFPLNVPAGLVPSLPNGLAQAPPSSEIGVGLRLYF